MLSTYMSSWSRERTRLLGEEHKVRLGMVLFLIVLLVLRPEVISHLAAVVMAMALMALSTVASLLGVRPQRLAAASGFEISAVAFAMMDLVNVTLLIYGTGGAASNFFALYAVTLIFAATFFRRFELALLTGLTCAFYSLIFLGGASAGFPFYVLAARLGALVLIVWQAHALTIVLHREKQGNDQLLRHLAEAVIVLDDQGRVVLANQAFCSMFAVQAVELEGLGITQLGQQSEPLQWVLHDVTSPQRAIQRTTRVANFPDEDLPLLEVTTISCLEDIGQKGGWVIVCRDLRDTAAVGEIPEETECDVVSPLANLRALSQTLYSLTERLDEDERWRAVSLIEQHTEAMKTILSRLLSHDLDETEVPAANQVNLLGLLSSTRRVLEIRDQQSRITIAVNCSSQLPPIEAERGSLGRLVLRVARELLHSGRPLDRLVLGGRVDGDRMVIGMELCPPRQQASEMVLTQPWDTVEKQLRAGMTELSRLLVQCGAVWALKRVVGDYYQVDLSVPLHQTRSLLVPETPPAAAEAAPSQGLDLLSQTTLSRLNNMIGVIRGRAELALASARADYVEQALVTAVEKADQLAEVLDMIASGLHREMREQTHATSQTPVVEPLQKSGCPLPVLIVDDEDGVRELLIQMFTTFGCDTAGASDAQEAIDYLQEQRPGLALVDLYMPGANGVTVLKRAREMYPDLPVILMSGCGSSGVAEALGDYEADGILAKPFSVSEVKDLATQMQAAS